MIIPILISILLAYLIGSLSPGFFFGKLIKKIDIRKYGTHNTGATNTYHVVGPIYGILTGIIDVAKGSAAFLIANSFLKPDIALLTSLFAILGHISPFYLNFKGGRGAATLIGIGITSLFFTQSFFAFLILATFSIIKIATAIKIKIIKPARKIYRLAGFIFPLSYYLYGQTPTFYFILTVLILFFIFDLVRLSQTKFNQALFKRLKKFAKEKEKTSFSTTTLFLFSSTLTIYFFPLEIAFISISFFLIGDTIAEIFGTAYRKYLLGYKSLEGSLVGFASCFLFGIFLIQPLNLTLIFILKASLFFFLIDLLSQNIDDNLTIPIGIAILLRLLG